MIRNSLYDEIDDMTLAYAAGFLDGEGCFICRRRMTKRGYLSYNIVVTCCNTNKPIIEWFQNTFGGKMHSTKGKTSKHRTVHNWQIVGRQAKGFAELIVPYLQQKSAQALLIILIQNTMTKGGPRVNKSILAERDRLMRILKEEKNAAWN
jgi:hypothetical protein